MLSQNSLVSTQTIVSTYILKIMESYISRSPDTAYILEFPANGFSTSSSASSHLQLTYEVIDLVLVGSFYQVNKLSKTEKY